MTADLTTSPAQDKKRKIFVTTALPYANGKFHLGHMMEYIQADIWVRFQRMRGHEVHWVCADDTHGAPIMIAAEKAGKSPQDFVAEIAATRKEYLDGFHLSITGAGADEHEVAHLAQAAHIHQAHIFAMAVVLFFILMLGPVGALLYLGLRLTARGTTLQTAKLEV